MTSAITTPKVILTFNPWAIVNTAGFVRVDDAETESGSCFAINTNGPENLAILCAKYNIKLLRYSSDLVFNGAKTNPYTEKDHISPLSIYGQSKAQAEQKVLDRHPSALIIRTSAFFGPWDNYNFVKVIIENLRSGKNFKVANDVMVSPTYVPDLVHRSLDLLLDGEKGIWHLTNKGQIVWSHLAYSIVDRSQLSTHLIEPAPLNTLGYKARRPIYSVLGSHRGSILPTLDNAIDRCLADMNAA